MALLDNSILVISWPISIQTHCL